MAVDFVEAARLLGGHLCDFKSKFGHYRALVQLVPGRSKGYKGGW